MGSGYMFTQPRGMIGQLPGRAGRLSARAAIVPCLLIVLCLLLAACGRYGPLQPPPAEDTQEPQPQAEDTATPHTEAPGPFEKLLGLLL